MKRMKWKLSAYMYVEGARERGREHYFVKCKIYFLLWVSVKRAESSGIGCVHEFKY